MVSRTMPRLGFELVDATPQELTAARRRVSEILGTPRPPTKHEIDAYLAAGMTPPLNANAAIAIHGVKKSDGESA